MTSTALKDLLERSVWTFVQAFCGVLIATNVVGDGSTDWQEVFVSALVAGGIAVAKSLVAAQTGNPNSTALPETHPDAADVK